MQENNNHLIVKVIISSDGKATTPCVQNVILVMIFKETHSA